MAIRTMFNKTARSIVCDAITEEYEENSKDSNNVALNSSRNTSSVITETRTKHIKRGYSNKSLPYSSLFIKL